MDEEFICIKCGREDVDEDEYVVNWGLCNDCWNKMIDEDEVNFPKEKEDASNQT